MSDGISGIGPDIAAIPRHTRAMPSRPNPHLRDLLPGSSSDATVAGITADSRRVQPGWFANIRRMVICVPSGITEVEKRAVRDSAQELARGWRRAG